MISNPFYSISILTSSFLAFFSWLLVTTLIVKIFSIKSYRARATLRLIPFLGLVIDFIAGQYSIAYWINPLSCASCVQKFLLVVFYPELKAYLLQNQISLVHYLGVDYQHKLFSSLFITLVATSSFLCVRQLIRAFFLAFSINRLLKMSTVCQRPLKNSLLLKTLKKHDVEIYTSGEIAIPFASYNNRIVLPQMTVNSLSEAEFEAVIAHELEHIKHLDPFVRLFYHSLAALFWWVPTHSWIKRLEQEQEMACDRNALSYGLDEKSMASALIKSLRQAATVEAAMCYFSSETNPVKARIQAILGLRNQNEEVFLGFSLFGVSSGIIFLVMCFLLTN